MSNHQHFTLSPMDELEEFENRPAATASLINSAKKMRDKPTFAERVALQKLNKKKVYHLNQVVLGFYILDFVVPSKLLIVEIDGASHDDRVNEDFRRDQWCRRMGLQVLRIPNEEADTICQRIAAYPDVEGFMGKWLDIQRRAAARKAKADAREKEWLLQERVRKSTELKEKPAVKRRSASSYEAEINALKAQVKDLSKDRAEQDTASLLGDFLASFK